MKTLTECTIIAITTALGLALLRLFSEILWRFVPNSWGDSENLGLALLAGILPYVLVGAAQGLASAKLLRSRGFAVLLLPSILLCGFEACVSLLGGFAGYFSTLLEISRWVALVLASGVIARFVRPANSL